MDWKTEYKNLIRIMAFFLFAYFLPLGNPNFDQALHSAFALAQWYAKEHFLLCLVPAFFIAGVIAVFVSQGSVIKYFGVSAKKWLSYLVASASGTILAVCSCTILPLFAGIYKRGAGLGPATAFLYSGPAINILAIILTARILGFELGIARVIGAVLFAVVIGLLMHLIFIKEERAKEKAQLVLPVPEETRPVWQTIFHFFVLVAIMVFATWGKPENNSGIWTTVYNFKWYLTSFFGILLVMSLVYILNLKKLYVLIGFLLVTLTVIIFPENPVIPFTVTIFILSILLSVSPGEPQEWMASSWGFAKQILPLLALGVLAAGLLLGSPGGKNGIIPDNWIYSLVGGNSFFANFFASVVGALMYFATLTEVPILQGLINNGMGKGPALALLLAGPAISIPNMLVIRSVIGIKKTTVYVGLVITMATISGLIYGTFF